MVILLVGVLAASAIPMFLDFRKQGKAAATRLILDAFRTGIKNQVHNARLRCGANPSAPAPFSDGFYNSLSYSLWYNDITSMGTDPTYGICTIAQIPNPSDRKFWDLPASQLAVTYTNGANAGTSSIIPANPFMTSTTAPNIGARVNLQQGGIYGVYGGPCAAVDAILAAGTAYHWVYNRDTGEVFPGTNTPGVNECSF